MDIQNILIFAFIGAACMFIVTGGVISMTTDVEPTQINLASGAAIGGTLGAMLAAFQSNDNLKLVLDQITSSTPPTTNYSSQEMKVGLPNF